MVIFVLIIIAMKRETTSRIDILAAITGLSVTQLRTVLKQNHEFIKPSTIERNKIVLLINKDLDQFVKKFIKEQKIIFAHKKMSNN